MRIPSRAICIGLSSAMLVAACGKDEAASGPEIQTASAPAPVPADGGMTARDGLGPAQQTIQSWNGDATLTRVDTNVLKGDGTAIMWQYSFASPGTSHCARVIVLAGSEPRIQDLGECRPEEAVSTDFVDSPIMLEAATTAGFQPDEESDAYLVLTHDAAAPGQQCWVVHTIADFDAENAYMRGWCVDAASGQFRVRLSGHN